MKNFRKYSTPRATIEINTGFYYGESPRDIWDFISKLKKEIATTQSARVKSLRRQELMMHKESLASAIRSSSVVIITLSHPKYRGYAREFSYEEGLDGKLSAFLKSKICETITSYRQETKAPPYFEKRWFDTFIKVSHLRAGVLTMPGQVLKAYMDKNLKSLYENKKPTTNTKYLGIELEFCAKIKENDFAIKLFKNGLHKFVQLKQDASLRPKKDENGYELAILLNETTFKSQLKQVTDVLAEIRAEAVNRRCGLHIHLDMRKRNKDLVYNNLVACQRALLKITDPNRYDTEFCRLVNSKKFPTKFDGSRTERYKTINAAAYYKYQTLEIRMHEGSVDFKQISNWASLLIKIANNKKKLKSSLKEIDGLKKTFKLAPKLYQYLVDRKCYWQVNSGINSPIRPIIPPIAPIEFERPTNTITQRSSGVTFSLDAVSNLGQDQINAVQRQGN
jgi:hypothetical protein